MDEEPTESSQAAGRILVVDDEKNAREALVELLRDEGYEVEQAADGKAALDRLVGFDPDLVLTDLKMPVMDGLTLLELGRKRSPHASFVVMTAFGSIDTAVRAMRDGAENYLTKPLDTDALFAVAARAIERAKLSAEASRLRQRLNEKFSFEHILGDHPSMQRLFKLVTQVSRSRSTALIQGETGTGKELIAAAIHHASPRADRPFVRLNCASLAESLLESELFGHEKGSFTGATARRTGRFELADSGTIFLDEIGEMPLSLQSKLLRVLQEGEFEHVGGSRTFAVDVRVIAATNRDLLAEVEAGRFREDLYFRLNVFPIMSPALRQRREDIPLLASHFVRKHGGKLGKHFDAISPRMLEQLESYDFPGNIRELENLIERATIVSESGTLELDQPLPVETAAAEASEAPGSAAADRTFHEVEVRMIRAALEACDWMVGGKSGAARKLEIPASTLRARIKRYGIERG